MAKEKEGRLKTEKNGQRSIRINREIGRLRR
jgi:hypothetical protein